MALDADLLALVVAALEVAAEELEAIDDGDEGMQKVMIPDSMVRTYREHMAMAEVISRIARAAPPERKRRLGAICREALDGASYPDIPTLRFPVLDEVRSQVDDALEVIRRRALVDGDVRDALRAGACC